jgi:hypothetical protein
MRISLIGAAIFTLLTATLAAGTAQGGRRRVGPIALNSVTENGPLVQLQLGDGTKVDVARSDIRISDASHRTGTAAGQKGQKQRAAASSGPERVKPSVSQLSEMSATSSRLPAVARIVYGPDGYVKRVKIQLFATEADASAFLQAARERKATARSRAPERNQ